MNTSKGSGRVFELDEPMSIRPKSELNYYRLEAGRFGKFVSYGLKSFAHEGVT